ncbi:MAG TPA: DMT family transporter [Candidatus Deferrimicrobium sp.]|nr:DMT family transporter [Candidatus Deferrimicrobium sp.]
MVKKETKLGILFGIVSIFLGGIQPVVARARPVILDPHIFSGMSCLFQALIFIPIFLLEFRLKKKSVSPKVATGKTLNRGSQLYLGKSKWVLFLIVGVVFSLALFLYYFGLDLAGAINGTLAQKSTAFFGLLFGYLILKERINKIQIISCCVLFFGMILAVTQGNFSLLQLNFGVVVILICSAIWMVGHTFSKPYLSERVTTSSELLIMRNLISAAVLILTYLMMYGPSQMLIIFDPTNAMAYIFMGFIYGSNLFCWYQIMKYLDISIGTIIITPQIIVTAFFGSIFLGEAFTIFHLIGLIIIIASILVIGYSARKP